MERPHAAISPGRLKPHTHGDETMKFMTIAALAGLFITSAAFAQTGPSPGSAPAGESSNAATLTQQQPQDGQWVAPYGQPVAGKTRAEVYQELVHSEQDGQLAYLNRTLYAHH
jgi:hypothetical protein